MNRKDLHKYQNYCVDYIKTHPEALIFLDCGLGKTVISLTAIKDLMFDRFEVGRVLVVAPLRVAKNVWPEEKENWDHTSSLRMSVITGTAKQREAALRTPADIYVINRENVCWLVNWLDTERIPWPFDMVVIDEISSFKNHQSLRWKAMRKVRPKIKRIVGLTGTPASNGLMDLWAEAFLIDKGERLGRFLGQYREAFFRPDAMNPYTGTVYSYEPLPGAEERIYKKISDIAVSMKALDYLDMPECISVVHRVDMEPNEWAVYDQMKSELLTELDGEEIDAANAAVLTGKLLQMANGAVYGEDGTVKQLHDRKLLMLEDLIEQANGQNVLVAYWYQHDRQRIIEHLTALGYTPRDIRADGDIADWNAGKIQIGLISPASAGHGLNIQKGGHILIWFSMVWSLEMYQQTNARLWRQGQKEVVTIHHIVARDTVDEDVMDALERKDTTQRNLIAAVKARIQK